MDAPSLPSPLPAQSLFLTEEVLTELRQHVRKEKFDTWFRGFRIESWTADEVWCTVPSSFVRDWLARNYTSAIERSVATALVTSSGVPATPGTEPGIGGGTRSKPRRVHIGLTRTEGAPATTGPAVVAEVLVGAGAMNSGAIATRVERSGTGDGATTELEADFEPFAPAPALRAVPASARPTRSGPADRPAGGCGAESGSGSGNGSFAPAAAPAHPPQARAARAPKEPYAAVGLNGAYVFEQFVVGPCNRLAHAAAIATADHPGRSYNPMFIHGGIGLGKSHLLQAIAHAVLQRQRDARVLYLSCEEFTNRYIQAIETKTVDEFRAYHRTADLLILDDVEFLAGKERTQEEFFHTFNDLFNRSHQIVLSSDRPPPEIPTIEERLVSRFKWGLVTDIGKPCFETRVAILKRKARLRDVELADEVAYYIAERVDSNIRELEGALITVLGYAALCEHEITLVAAEEALRGVPSARPLHVSMNDVLSLITSEFALTAREITGKGRSQAVSFPRQVGMYLSRHNTDHSLEEIGRFFGNRDHTTVLYAVQKITARSGSDRVVKDLLASLAQRLRR